MTDWQEFKLIKGKKIQVWRIRQDGEFYHTEHGQEGGKFQSFSDRPGEKGKPGTKAFVDSISNAKFNVEREIRKKEEHGYIRYINGQPVKETITELNWDKPLPKPFVSYKPQTDISESSLKKIHDAGKARYTRKYDGQAHLLVHHSWGWEIYTRRMDLATERFPKHIAELEESPFDIGTILVGEVICKTSEDKDDFKAVSRFCRSDPPEARKLIENNEIPEPIILIFDMLFYNKEDLKNTSYDNRAKIWQTFKSNLIGPVAYHSVSPENWAGTAKAAGWEGFVVVDGGAVPGDKFYSFDGDAKRPKGHHKLKPIHTEDVVIYAGIKGSGKRLNAIGSVLVKQKYPKDHPKSGQWFSCGKCGSGFTDQSLLELEKLCKDYNIPIFEKEKDASYIDLNNCPGIVCSLEYSERQIGTQKFRFPVFCNFRFDKLIEECEAQQLAPEEE